MNTIYVCIAVIVIGFILLAILNRKSKKQNAAFYSVYTPNGLALVQRLETMIQNNSTLPLFGPMKIYHEMFGENPKDLDDFERLIGVAGYADLPENTLPFVAGQYVDDITWVLAHRHRNQCEKLYSYGKEESLKKFALHIHDNEFIHEYASKGVDWHEEKTITTSVNYSGFRITTGSRNFNYTMGTLNVMPNTRTYFNLVDRGSLYVTNKRLIFVGKEKGQNRTIDLDDILEFSLFRDGILIGKANGKKPLIEFAPYIIQPGKPPTQRDHMNRIIRALNRVISGTQNTQLAEN